MLSAEAIESLIVDYTWQVWSDRVHGRSGVRPVKPSYGWYPDWSEYLWRSPGTEFAIPGLEKPLLFLKIWTPAGEEFDDYSGPQYMLFGYDGRTYAKAGRNVSHHGCEFEGQFFRVEGHLVAREYWVRVGDDDTRYDIPEEF